MFMHGSSHQPSRESGAASASRLLALFAATGVALALAGCGSSTSSGSTTTAPATSTAPATTSSATGLPRAEHVVVVIEENHAADAIVGNADAPYINSLVATGAQLTDSHGTTHPSQPNYFELFSGGTQGVKGDECPAHGAPFSAANLATSLVAAHGSFAGYSEDLPATGSTVCTAGGYARKHNPWSSFTNVAAGANRPFTAFPQGNYNKLPTVSFVVPNLANDMHDGTVAQADTWLKDNLDGYRRWAATHHSLLVVTWDEDDFTRTNHILTVLVGAMVKPGVTSGQHVTHDEVLRTIEDLTGAKPVGNSADAKAITGIWRNG